VFFDALRVKIREEGMTLPANFGSLN
jgi:hypothetical protein